MVIVSLCLRENQWFSDGSCLLYISLGELGRSHKSAAKMFDFRLWLLSDWFSTLVNDGLNTGLLHYHLQTPKCGLWGVLWLCCAARGGHCITAHFRLGLLDFGLWVAEREQLEDPMDFGVQKPTMSCWYFSMWRELLAAAIDLYTFLLCILSHGTSGAPSFTSLSSINWHNLLGLLCYSHIFNSRPLKANGLGCADPAFVAHNHSCSSKDQFRGVYPAPLCVFPCEW